MIKQTLKPQIKPYDKGQYITCKDFYYCCPKYGVSVLIPCYFVSDGASIPAFAEPTTGNGFSPEFIGPALIHDFGYATARDSMGHHISKSKWDKVFIHALKLNGIGWWDRKKIASALRLFGGFAWRAHRRQDE